MGVSNLKLFSRNIPSYIWCAVRTLCNQYTVIPQRKDVHSMDLGGEEQYFTKESAACRPKLVLPYIYPHRHLS